MKYVLLVYNTEDAYTEEERDECMEESVNLCHKLADEGSYLYATPLQPVGMATSVKVREGERLVTDGPYAETYEQLGGFYLIEAKNLDAAIEIAGRIPGARRGIVEIRPLHVLTNLPASITVRESVEA